LLQHFPPTLLISGTRSFDLSSVVHTHCQLVKANAVAELHVWDGMWHGFTADVTLPESREAHRVIGKFFHKYLSR
jgi:acetyl esterase/lipase